MLTTRTGKQSDEMVDFFAFLWKSRRVAMLGLLAGLTISAVILVWLDRASEKIQDYNISFEHNSQALVPSQSAFNDMLLSSTGIETFCRHLIQAATDVQKCDASVFRGTSNQSTAVATGNVVTISLNEGLISPKSKINQKAILASVIAVIDSFNTKNSTNYRLQADQLNMIFEKKIHLLKIINELEKTPGITENLARDRSAQIVKDSNFSATENLLSKALELLSLNINESETTENLKFKFLDTYHELVTLEKYYDETFNKTTTQWYPQIHHPNDIVIGQHQTLPRKANRILIVFISAIVCSMSFLGFASITDFIRLHANEITRKEQHS